MILKVLTKMGAMVQAHGMLYKAVEQMVILYGSESWVVTGAILKVLEGFHHRSSWRIAGMVDQRAEDVEWEYTPVFDTM